jgi:hypothetical protein
MPHNLDIRSAQPLTTNAQRTTAAHLRALQAAAYTELLLTQALKAISDARASSVAMEALRQSTPAQQEQPTVLVNRNT